MISDSVNKLREQYLTMEERDLLQQLTHKQIPQ